MAGYGGLLSGLVQGYGSAIAEKEQRAYDEKKQKRADEMKMYQTVIDSPDADSASKAAAWQKLEATIHGSEGKGGKAGKVPGLLSKIGGLLTGHTGSQPQQGGYGMAPPHFYSPEEKENQKLYNMDSEEKLKDKYLAVDEERNHRYSMELEEARIKGRQYRTPAGPKPGGMPWETGQTIVQDGVQTWVPTNPPKDVQDAHQMAESLARTNGKSVLENYDQIWTMKAQGLTLDQIKKQASIANTESQIGARDNVLTTDANRNRVFVSRPGAGQSRFGSMGMTPPPTKDDAAPQAPPPSAPVVTKTGIQAPPPKAAAGRGSGGGVKPMTATQKKAIETTKDKAMEAADRRARAKIAAAPGNKKVEAEARETFRRERDQAQKDYEKQIAIMTGQQGGVSPTQTPTGHKIGDKIKLKSGKEVTITAIGPNGFNYK